MVVVTIASSAVDNGDLVIEVEIQSGVAFFFYLFLSTVFVQCCTVLSRRRLSPTLYLPRIPSANAVSALVAVRKKKTKTKPLDKKTPKKKIIFLTAPSFSPSRFLCWFRSHPIT